MLLAVPRNKKQERIATALAGEAKIREELKELARLKFLDATDLKGIYYRIGHKVDLALKAYDDDLEKKRNLLKSKFLEDQSCLTYEYVEKAQHYAQKLYEDKKKRAEDIVIERENERLDFVNEMRTRQKMMNCDEYRSRKSKERNMMLAKSQLLQVAEKEAIKGKEEQISNMYNELTRRDDSYHVENAEKRKQVVERAILDDFLKMQITAKEYARAELESLKEEEKMVLKMDQERMVEEDRLNAERECKRRNLSRKQFMEQVMSAEEVKNRRNNYEREMDNIIFEALQRESKESTQQEHEERIQLAQDLGNYHQVWKELDEFQKNLDQEDDRVIIQHREEINDEIQQNRDKLKEQKRKTDKEMYVIWGEQIKTRQKHEDEIKDIINSEKVLYESCMIDIDSARIRQRCDDAKHNQSDLQTQMSYNELMKKRNKDNNLRLDKDMLDFEANQHHDCRHLDDTNLNKVHPFFCALECGKTWNRKLSDCHK